MRNYPTNVFARPAKPVPFKMPKRLKVVYFVANTRLVQRALMLILMGWIIILVYKLGLVELMNGENRILQNKNDFFNPISPSKKDFQKEEEIDSREEISFLHLRSNNKHVDGELWKLLSFQHWSAIFGYYNISLSTKYISILPSIQLSVPVTPESAKQNRHPLESDPQIFRNLIYSSGIHSSIDPNDEYDDLLHGAKREMLQPQWTNGEIFITLALSIPSIIFIVYLFVVLYRCMCTRNYAEWRASWSQTFNFKKKKNNKLSSSEDLVCDTIISKLQEQQHEIEFITSNSDTPFAVSICMRSDIYVWDVYTGDWQSHIKRSNQNKVLNKSKFEFQQQCESTGCSSDSTYGSSPGNTSNDSIESEISERQRSFEIQRTESMNSGYNFAPYYSKYTTSQNVISDLILNAVVNQENQNNLNTSEINVINAVDSPVKYSPIWCCEIFGKLIIVGCSDGRIEVWDAINGQLYWHYEEHLSGVTGLKATKTKLVVTRLNGTLEIFHLEIINGFCIDIASANSCSPSPRPALGQMIRYNLQHSLRAHLQPITSFQIESTNIITGSLDHLLKVYRCDTANCVYTLHGHCGGITVIHIDQVVNK